MFYTFLRFPFPPGFTEGSSGRRGEEKYRLARIDCEILLKFLSSLLILGTLKSSMLEVFTPEKWTNTTNWGYFCGGRTFQRGSVSHQVFGIVSVCQREAPALLFSPSLGGVGVSCSPKSG